MLWSLILLPFTCAVFAYKVARWIAKFVFMCIHILIEMVHESRLEDSQKQELVDKLNKVDTYEKYIKAANELDKINGYDIWKRDNESKLYDYEQIEDKCMLHCAH